jgi:hypothetical protein
VFVQGLAVRFTRQRRIRPNGTTDEIKTLPELEKAKGIIGDS